MHECADVHVHLGDASVPLCVCLDGRRKKRERKTGERRQRQVTTGWNVHGRKLLQRMRLPMDSEVVHGISWCTFNSSLCMRQFTFVLTVVLSVATVTIVSAHGLWFLSSACIHCLCFLLHRWKYSCNKSSQLRNNLRRHPDSRCLHYRWNERPGNTSINEGPSVTRQWSRKKKLKVNKKKPPGEDI